MSVRENNANLFVDRLCTAVKVHFSQFAQEENEELQRLQSELNEARGEITRLTQELASSKTEEPASTREAEVVRPSPSLAKIKDVQQQEVADIWEDETLENDGVTPANDGALEEDNAQAGFSEVVPDPSAGARAGLSDDVPDPTKITKDLADMGDTEAEDDLERKFRELDPRFHGYIDVSMLAEHMTQDVISDERKRNAEVHRYKHAVQVLNKALALGARTAEEAHKLRFGVLKGQIQFATFEVLMLEDEEILQEQFGADTAKTLVQIRESLVDEVITDKLSHAFHVTKSFIGVDDTAESRRVHHRRFLKYLEPVSGVMIMTNALLIGISLDTDPDWDGWFVIEILFSIFFVAELVVNVWVTGFIDHFFGEDWLLSWFDLSIVCSAVLDTAVTVMDKIGISKAGGGNSYHLLLLRLVRLLRVTRMLKVLRLKIFKELTLMVNGVIAGLRTLFWAIVLLTFFMYVMGVFMRQVIAPENTQHCGALGKTDCTRGEKNFDEYSHIMFGSVVRSMLAMFFCFTEGCASPDGTPFIWHLWDAYGPFLVLGYLAAFIFITFGVLNLIMAVMVENTLANSAKIDAERQFGEDAQHVRKAHELHRLMRKLCKVNNSAVSTALSTKSRKRRGLKTMCQQFRSKPKEKHDEEERRSSHLHLRINQDQFEEMMRDSEVNDLLDDLDISNISRGQLFDILDADGSGFLSVSELVYGLMKLRGPADKGDVVATSLCLRHLQKQVGKIEHLLHSKGKATRVGLGDDMPEHVSENQVAAI